MSFVTKFIHLLKENQIEVLSNGMNYIVVILNKFLVENHNNQIFGITYW